jgi:hypothetical protein
LYRAGSIENGDYHEFLRNLPLISIYLCVSL